MSRDQKGELRATHGKRAVAGGPCWLLALWLVSACGMADDADGSGGSMMTGSSAGGSAGEAGAAGGTAGAEAAGGSSSTGGDEAGAAGAGGGTAGAEAGAAGGEAGEAGASAGAGGTGNDDCPESLSFPVAGQTFVIQSVNFTRDEVIIVNATNEDQTLPSTWEWCSATAYAPPTYGFMTRAGDLVIPPGGTFAIDVPGTAVSGATDLDLIPGEGEFALYNTTGGFQQPFAMESYVTWGDGGGGRENVAVMAGRWTFQQRVEIKPGHAGLIGFGRTDRASGYISVPLRCL